MRGVGAQGAGRKSCLPSSGSGDVLRAVYQVTHGCWQNGDKATVPPYNLYITAYINSNG